jgi:probable HAF family extracellular repeat protein
MELVAGRGCHLAAPLFASFTAALLACSADHPRSVAATGVAQGRLVSATPQITISSLGPGMALGVNDGGQIAGTTFATPANDGRATLWNPDGSVADLFASAPDGRSYAFDVNDLGAAAGVSVYTGFPFTAFKWTSSGGLVGLQGPAGTFARARSINTSGQVAGDAEGGLAGATLWQPDGTATSLGTLGGPLSGANDINDAGQIVGWSHIPANVHHAFLWTQGAGMQDLGTLGGSWSAATGINELGHVTGWSQTAGGRTHAFLWKPETGMVDIDPLGSETYAEAVNDHDEVVGYHYPQGTALAFFWSRDTGLVELGTLGGGIGPPASPWHSRAFDLNENGVVVGDSTDGITPELATVWTVDVARGDEGVGFLPPIPNDGTGIFKAGRTIPVKFRLASASGAPVTGATASLRVFEISEGSLREVDVVARGAPSASATFRYDATADLYVFHMSTSALVPGAYLLRVELDDGSAHEVRITLR